MSEGTVWGREYLQRKGVDELLQIGREGDCLALWLVRSGPGVVDIHL
jgi:hypothetical protein